VHFFSNANPTPEARTQPRTEKAPQAVAKTRTAGYGDRLEPYRQNGGVLLRCSYPPVGRSSDTTVLTPRPVHVTVLRGGLTVAPYDCLLLQRISPD
jgi:hypothetical protein